MVPPPTSGDNSSPAAVAGYVASMSAELAILARRNGLESLSYLLEMVRLEAEGIRRADGGPAGR